jgi:hypothetical protein
MIILLVLFVTKQMTDGAYVSTTTQSSTLPVGSRDALERAHMGGNIHLQGRH